MHVGIHFAMLTQRNELSANPAWRKSHKTFIFCQIGKLQEIDEVSQ